MEEPVLPAKLESFLRWGSAIGISDAPIPDTTSKSCIGRSLCVSYFPEAGGRGLAASRDLRKGELVLRVPKAALMTSDGLIGNDHMLSVALGKHPVLSSSQILCVALLNEVNKGRSSWWYPYLNQLPQSYDLLACFGRFEIKALQIDDAIWAAEKSVMKVKTEWEETTPLMCELGLKPRLSTLKAWRWASATVSSRTMHVPWDTAGCLCPVGDYFNYAPPEEYSSRSNAGKLPGADSFSSVEGESTQSPIGDLSDTDTDRLIDAGYDEAAGCYCFYAKRDYGKGEQVLLTYGTHTNLELLEHYGFILQQNPNDKVFISLHNDIYSLCPWPRDSLYITRGGKPSYALLSTLRLWATPPHKRRSAKRSSFSSEPISNENEANVMKWITSECRVLLSICPTSIEEDVEDLRIICNIQNCSGVCAFLVSKGLRDGGRRCCGSELCEKTRCVDMWKLAVGWRRMYKEMLHECISYCTKVLDGLC